MLAVGAEMTHLAVLLGLTREVVRIWFCNRRQALKNAAAAAAAAASTTAAAARHAPAMTSLKYRQ